MAATGLTLAEFERLLPVFQSAYEHQYPPELPYEGKTRQRSTGGGTTGSLVGFADKLLGILVYQKTNPLQVMHGLQCALSQSQANYWMHRLLPALQHALRAMGQAPERDEGKISKLCKAVQEFHTFIDHNQVFISNYEERYRNSERISTGFVESTVHQVVSRRMVKK